MFLSRGLTTMLLYIELRAYTNKANEYLRIQSAIRKKLTNSIYIQSRYVRKKIGLDTTELSLYQQGMDVMYRSIYILQVV